MAHFLSRLGRLRFGSPPLHHHGPRHSSPRVTSDWVFVWIYIAPLMKLLRLHLSLSTLTQFTNSTLKNSLSFHPSSSALPGSSSAGNRLVRVASPSRRATQRHVTDSGSEQTTNTGETTNRNFVNLKIPDARHFYRKMFCRGCD